MKLSCLRLATSALAALLLCGCTPSAPPAPSPAKEPVTGAFGFKLGEMLDPKYEVATNRNGSISYMVKLNEDQKPFRSASIDITPERRIYCIRVETGLMEESECFALQKTLAASLREKYGLKFDEPSVKKADDDNMPAVFGGRERDIVLLKIGSFLTVSYTDQVLLGEIEKGQQAKRDKAAKSL